MASGNLNLALVLRAVDEVTRPVRRITRALRGIRRNARVDRLIQDMRRLGRTLRRVAGVAAAAGRRIATAVVAAGGAATAAGGGFFLFARRWADMADSIAKKSGFLGIGIGELQEFRYAAQRSGLEVQQFDQAYQRFSRRTGQAAKGTGEAIKGFQALGLKKSDLFESDGSLKSTVTLLEEVADRIGNIRDIQEQQAVAMSFFDSEGVAMINLLKDGSKGLRTLRQDFRDLGGAITEQAARDAEEFNDRMLDLDTVAGSLRNEVMTALLPSLKDLSTELKNGLSENRTEVVEEITSTLRALGQIIRGVATGFNYAAKAVGGWDNLMIGLVGLLGLKAFGAVVNLGRAVLGLGRQFWGFARGVLPFLLKGVKALFLVVRLHPFVAIASAIAGAAYAVYENWEPISQFFQDLWDGIGEIFNSAWDGYVNIWRQGFQMLSELFQGLVNLLPESIREKIGILAQIETVDSRPVNTLTGSQQIGGRLAVEIQSPTPVRIRELQSDGLDLDVDTGMMMVAP